MPENPDHYRWQAAIFALSRRPVLLGRKLLAPRIQQGTQVLEVGCGTGQNLPALHRAVGPRGHVLGLECSKSLGLRAEKLQCPGLQVLRQSFEQHPLAPNSLDAIVFSYSLSMMPAYQQAIQQSLLALRPGGQILVLDFLHCRLNWLAGLMGKMHVQLGEQRHELLQQSFQGPETQVHRAYGGLWSWYFLQGHKSHGSK